MRLATIVEDQEIDAVEQHLDLGLHFGRGEIADAAVDEIAGEHFEQVRRLPARGGDALQALAQRGRRHLAVDEEDPSRFWHLP